MAIDTQQKILLFGAAAAVRLLLFTVFPALPELLAGRVEVSTPVTSFKRCMCMRLNWWAVLTTN
jgi:phosphatidylinositol glycan class U